MSGPQPDLLEEVQQIIAGLEGHPDPSIREQLAALLERIDAIHRSALTALVGMIQSMAGQAFLNRLAADPAVRLLLMSYDLIAVDRRILTEEALDTVREGLRARGVEVELADVVGGVVYVRLRQVGADPVPESLVRDRLEQALRAELIGFQELVLNPPPAVPVVQLGRMQRAREPVFRDALPAAELSSGEMRGLDLDGTPVLMARVDGEFYALANRCGESPLPLHLGTLEGAELRCPWHGCRYDVRSGRRIDPADPAGERLTVFPVAVEGGIVRVALDTRPVETR